MTRYCCHHSCRRPTSWVCSEPASLPLHTPPLPQCYSLKLPTFSRPAYLMHHSFPLPLSPQATPHSPAPPISCITPLLPPLSHHATPSLLPRLSLSSLLSSSPSSYLLLFAPASPMPLLPNLPNLCYATVQSQRMTKMT